MTRNCIKLVFACRDSDTTAAGWQDISFEWDWKRKIIFNLSATSFSEMLCSTQSFRFFGQDSNDIATFSFRRRKIGKVIPRIWLGRNCGFFGDCTLMSFEWSSCCVNLFAALHAALVDPFSAHSVPNQCAPTGLGHRNPSRPFSFKFFCRLFVVFFFAAAILCCVQFKCNFFRDFVQFFSSPLWPEPVKLII